jgi:hypothetical protein
LKKPLFIAARAICQTESNPAVIERESGAIQREQTKITVRLPVYNNVEGFQVLSGNDIKIHFFYPFHLPKSHSREQSCSALGSSLYMGKTIPFTGVLSVQSENPDFYNWNRVMVRYCDGSSSLGCSAGGLATFIHCDQFSDLLPNRAKIKCMPDAVFFSRIQKNYL